MNISLRFYAALLLVAVCLAARAQSETIDFAAQGYGNTEVITQPIRQNDITVRFQGGTTPATYYDSGKAIRIYGGGSFTVSATANTIVKLVLTFVEKYAPDTDGSLYTDSGKLKKKSNSVKEWTAATTDGVTEVTFTRPSSGHWRLQKLEVFFGENGGGTTSDETSVAVKLSAAQYGTLYYGDKALIVPKNISACTYKLAGKQLAVSRVYGEGDVIAAGTAVVLTGDAGEYTFEVCVTQPSSATDPDNLLLGTDVETALATDVDCYFYQLSLNATNTPGTIGFYWGNASGGAFTNGAHKAYLKIPKPMVSAAKTHYLFSDVVTAIATPDAQDAQRQSARRYDTAGRRVPDNYKGVVIENGKRFVVR